MRFAPFEHADVRTPRQARSEATLERLLRAAHRLLEKVTFDQLSVQQVVAEAGCSVGTFYARFADKHALLDSLDELYARDLIGEFEGAAEAWSSRSLTLEELIAEATRLLVRFHRQRRGVVRALIVYARQHPGGRFGERSRRMAAQTPGIVRAFLHHTTALGHADPRSVARLGLIQALTLVREYVLFPEGPASLQPLKDEELVAEVERSWLAYLQAGTKGTRG